MKNSRNPTLKKTAIKILDALDIAETKIKLVRQDIVLLYHSVETEQSGYFHSVAKKNFEIQIDYLMSRFQIVSLEEIFYTSSTVSRVALTFDDAYEELYWNVYPCLLNRNIPATIFVPTLFVDEQRRLIPSKDHLSWDQMKVMSSSGLVKFESHTHSHLDAVADIDRLKEDVELSIHLLEKKLGRRPKYFAYPFGTYNGQTNEILLSCGFQKLLTIESIPVKGKSFEGRFDISRKNESLEYFKLTIAGVNNSRLKNFGAYLAPTKSKKFRFMR